MKVCHVVYQSWPTQCGSVSRLDQLLAAQLATGLSIFAVSGPFQSGYSSDLIEIRKSIKYYRTVTNTSEIGFSNAGGWSGRVRKLVRIFSFIRQLNQICIMEKPDILHAHATFLMGLATWWVAFKLGVPFVYEVRSTWEEDIEGGYFVGVQRGIIRFFERMAILLSDGTVFISNGLKQHYCGSLLQIKNAIIYNCVEECNSATNQRNLQTLRIGYIGSLVEYEGLPLLLEAGNCLKARGVQFSIDIIGSGIVETYLKDYSKKLNLDDVVIFHGRVNSDEVEFFYDQIDIIVLPRKNLLITNKVAGLKPIEAFSHKKIVIAADVGGMKELFSDRVHGLLFKAENLNDLLDKILWVYHNDNAAFKLAIEGYNLYKSKFTLDAMGKQYVDFYHKLLPQVTREDYHG